MAGNIVKWWKHKILGGYKQFSVQECTTDSEELMYHQVRAPSSCSAPPDLLLVSDRENNIPLKSPVVNIISATSPAGSASHQKHQQQHHHNSHLQQQQQHQSIPAHSTPKDVLSKNTKNGGNGGGKMHQPQCGMTNGKHINSAQTQHGAADAPIEQGKDERIHLEEFTCDVSVESGKSTQPLQFSFTFYDLDGHHGKITKDDIVGIVYTIYESIGKSVVVPHCGSKTINVRLTVSPEGKSKAAAAAAAANSAVTTSKFRKNVGHSMRDSTQQMAHGGHSRRQHRYRPRKLVKTDDEDDDSTSEKEVVKKSFNSNKAKCCQQQLPVQPEEETNLVDVNCGGHENIYENMTNLKEECKRCLTQQEKSELYLKQASSRVKMLRKARKQKYQDHCHETRQRSLSVGNESCWKTRANNLIKTHNITHSQQQQHQTDNNTQMGALTAATGTGATTSPDQDCVDGCGPMVGGSSHNTHSQVINTSTATAECWNNALNRNDLIDIIRESMEKNRLCFQSNGKPQANVSPIRHRQRSNTVSKIPTATSNILSTSNNNHHNYSSNITSTNNNNIINNNNTESTTITHHQQHPHESNNTHHNHHHHPQPHIPIYHQQMAINPAVLAAQNGIVHSKMNLCGYDSFLHATICSGGTSHSPPPPTSNTAALIQPSQPVATVQPIMTSSPKIYVSNQVKTSKILRNSSSTTTHHQHHSQQNSPQFQGYHRLLSSSGNHSAAKMNISLLNALSPNLSNQEKFHQTIEHVEKWLTERDRKLLKNASGAVDEKSKKDVKNYDNLLFAKLTEKLQQQQLLQDTVVGQRGSGNKENIRRMHNSQNHNVKMHHRQRSHHHHQQQQQQQLASSTSGSSGSNSEKFSNSSSSKYVTLIPINGDPLECENLLHQTSDDESSTIPRTPTPPNTTMPTVATTTVATALTATPAATASASATACTTAPTSNNDTATTTTVTGPTDEVRSSSSSSSMVHRYVHEHIHHHYHHFENKDE